MDGTDEFVEAEQDLDADDVDWLDGDDEDELASRPAALPALTTRRRLAGSLVLVVAVLVAAGYGANGVYQGDLVAEAAANELILQTPAGPGLTLPDLGGIVSAETWVVQPRTEVAVPLVNLSPDPVTLLPGAMLLGMGLSGSSLGGTSAVVLEPGQSTVLRGYVSANCAYSQPDAGAAAATSLEISARTSGGGLGVSSVALGSAYGSVRDRICTAQDGKEADLNLEQSMNTQTRSLTLTFTAASHADVPLHYAMAFNFNAGPLYGANPQVSGPLTGVLVPGGSATLAFTLTPADCPGSGPVPYIAPSAPPSASVDVAFSFDGNTVATAGAGQDVSTLLNEMCG